jgi:hypothetical protein
MAAITSTNVIDASAVAVARPGPVSTTDMCVGDEEDHVTVVEPLGQVPKTVS